LELGICEWYIDLQIGGIVDVVGFMALTKMGMLGFWCNNYRTVFYEFLKCGLYNTYNTYNMFCLIQ
jgi:hypothetical protein